jgi:antitoxin CptB
MGDNELLDVLLGRADLSGGYDDPDIRRLVEQMKAL